MALVLSGQVVPCDQNDPDAVFAGRVFINDGGDIEQVLSRLEAERVWLAIIDTAATHNTLALRAITCADFCLIPARPTPADIEAAIPTLIAIRKLGRRFAFILNQTPPRGGRLSEAATSLNSLGHLALPFMGQRNDHQDALGAGLGVSEFAPHGKAAEEIRGLWRWLSQQITAEATGHEAQIKAAG